MENERRRYERVPFENAVSVRILEGGRTMGALGKDVSEGGLRFTAGSFVGLNNRLLMEFEVPPGGRPVRVVGRPAWVRQIAASDTYEVGNLFLELSEEDRGSIRRYVETVRA